MMILGNLVFDASLGLQGIIVDTKDWSERWEGRDPIHKSMQYEHTILYEDGHIDSAYENELKVINESR